MVSALLIGVGLCVSQFLGHVLPAAVAGGSVTSRRPHWDAGPQRLKIRQTPEGDDPARLVHNASHAWIVPIIVPSPGNAKAA